MRVVRAAILAGGHRADFRVVEFSVQSNHVHLLVEAEGAASLTRGMNGLEVRLARRINRALGRSGAFFADRYHARSLRTPTEVRRRFDMSSSTIATTRAPAARATRS
jgi:REP element-mobilizing transposase RayT